MKTRHSCFTFTVLLVSLLCATAMACPPPECPACYAWDGDSCVWDCGPTDICCNDACCSNKCCERFTKCCSDPDAVCCGFAQTCCDNVCCYNECCDPGLTCCGVDCCSNECCGGTCCDDPGETCCGSNCCVSDCCSETHFCCGAVGKECCDGTDCYDPATEKCCGNGNGHTCLNEQTCCGDFGCCLASQCCDETGCVTTCPGSECCNDGTCVSSCPTDKCCDDGVCKSECSGDTCCDEGVCEALEGCEKCASGIVEDDPTKCPGECNNCTDAQCHYDDDLCDPGEVCNPRNGTCCDTASAGDCVVTAADIDYNALNCSPDYGGQCMGGAGSHIKSGWTQVSTHQDQTGPGTVGIYGCGDVTFYQCINVSRFEVWECLTDDATGEQTINYGWHEHCPGDGPGW